MRITGTNYASLEAARSAILRVRVGLGWFFIGSLNEREAAAKLSYARAVRGKFKRDQELQEVRVYAVEQYESKLRGIMARNKFLGEGLIGQHQRKFLVVVQGQSKVATQRWVQLQEDFEGLLNDLVAGDPAFAAPKNTKDMLRESQIGEPAVVRKDLFQQKKRRRRRRVNYSSSSTDSDEEAATPGGQKVSKDLNRGRLYMEEEEDDEEDS